MNMEHKTKLVNSEDMGITLSCKPAIDLRVRSWFTGAASAVCLMYVFVWGFQNLLKDVDLIYPALAGETIWNSTSHGDMDKSQARQELGRQVALAPANGGAMQKSSMALAAKSAGDNNALPAAFTISLGSHKVILLVQKNNM